MRILKTLGCLSAAFFTSAALAESERPLLDLLRLVPVDAERELTIFDLAASRAETAPFFVGQDAFTKGLAAFAPVYPPNGFDTQTLFLFKDGAKASMGFSIFELDALVGWGQRPEAPMIVTGDFKKQEIADALAARDYDIRTVSDVKVWHRQADFEMDLERRAEDPFAGELGVATRFALVGRTLFATRSWPQMERLLSNGTGLVDNADIAAIFETGYAFGDAGSFVGAVLPRERPVRRIDPGILIQRFLEPGQKLPDLSGLPHLPIFLEYGLLMWQDGARITGAIAIPFILEDTAQEAKATFELLFNRLVSPGRQKPFAEVLPFKQRFEIIQTDKRYVLILAFEETVEVDPEKSFRMFLLNPHKRLVEMWYLRDLGLLIGGAL